MPFWLDQVCDWFTNRWLTATPTDYWSLIFFVVGFGWALARIKR
jgi:hypothetical protein